VIKEFKEFAIKGNMIDMAVGIIIGAAFGKVVSSLVSDVIMPPIGAILAGVDFTNLVITLRQPIGDKPAVLLHYGKFIQAMVDFLIVSFAVFLLVKGVNKFRRAQEKPSPPPPPPPPSKEETLLAEIRDILKGQKQA
ncbi:MAG: large-conductance mechanosensitive channel protein MscL, partial [Candidatus Omnitrophica bacterium]|nr:large-conductance mechanosensitive channel protein MscL [Candidatus Omnitrophota bacterium]